jgi:hypothetical protein
MILENLMFAILNHLDPLGPGEPRTILVEILCQAVDTAGHYPEAAVPGGQRRQQLSA